MSDLDNSSNSKSAKSPVGIILLGLLLLGVLGGAAWYFLSDNNKDSIQSSVPASNFNDTPATSLNTPATNVDTSSNVASETASNSPFNASSDTSQNTQNTQVSTNTPKDSKQQDSKPQGAKTENRNLQKQSSELDKDSKVASKSSSKDSIIESSGKDSKITTESSSKDSTESNNANNDTNITESIFEKTSANDSAKDTESSKENLAQDSKNSTSDLSQDSKDSTEKSKEDSTQISSKDSSKDSKESKKEDSIEDSYFAESSTKDSQKISNTKEDSSDNSNTESKEDSIDKSNTESSSENIKNSVSNTESQENTSENSENSDTQNFASKDSITDKNERQSSTLDENQATQSDIDRLKEKRTDDTNTTIVSSRDTCSIAPECDHADVSHSLVIASLNSHAMVRADEELETNGREARERFLNLWEKTKNEILPKLTSNVSNVKDYGLSEDKSQRFCNASYYTLVLQDFGNGWRDKKGDRSPIYSVTYDVSCKDSKPQIRILQDSIRLTNMNYDAFDKIITSKGKKGDEPPKCDDKNVYNQIMQASFEYHAIARADEQEREYGADARETFMNLWNRTQNIVTRRLTSHVSNIRDLGIDSKNNRTCEANYYTEVLQDFDNGWSDKKGDKSPNYIIYYNIRYNENKDIVLQVTAQNRTD